MSSGVGHCENRCPIREISRRTGLVRNTVKKYLRSDETEPTYTRRVSPSKLDPYAEKLATWLGIETRNAEAAAQSAADLYSPCATDTVNYVFKENVAGFSS
jgi:transposase